jgi:Effector Associated Constant Component 1
VDAHITVLNGNEAAEVSELFHWLKNDRGVRQPVSRTAGQAGPAELSAAVEIIVAGIGAIGAGGTAQLVSSLQSWRRTRSPELIIEVKTEKGRKKITGRNLSSDDIAELTRILDDGA